MKNRNQPKILLAAPFSNLKDYIFIPWYLHASTLNYSNYDILLCDNSHDETYHKKIQKMGINCLHVSPEGKHARQYITESQLLLRDHFLKGNYDIYFSLEVDVFLPKNGLEKLVSEMQINPEKIKILAAPYYYGFGKESNLLFQYFTDDGKGGLKTTWPTLDKMIEFLDGTVKPIYENGIGCTLIAREIIEKYPWRWQKGHTGFSDTHFYSDLWKDRKYQNRLDTSMICHHYNMNWSGNLDHIKSNDLDFIKHN